MTTNFTFRSVKRQLKLEVTQKNLIKFLSTKSYLAVCGYYKVLSIYKFNDLNFQKLI